MSDKKNKASNEAQEPELNREGMENIDIADTLTTDDPTVDEDVVGDDEEGGELETLKNLLQQREEALEKEKKEYMFLMAEFDNFKKRTVRERADLLKNAAESVLKGLLPIVDDFERGLAAIKDSSDVESVKQGMELIYKKLMDYLSRNGVKEMTSTGAQFDADLHEAVAMVPGDEAYKGMVIDTVQKGYMLNDKVLRHAKVAVGQ